MASAQDYSEMSYFALKAECNKQGLGSKGKRPELVKRLIGKDKPPESQEELEIKASLPEKTPTVILPSLQEELNKFLPDTKFIPVVDTTKYKAWLTNERLQTLGNKLKPIFAGKGTFEFQLNYEGAAFQVEFNGGAAGKESITLIIEDIFLIQKAQEYCRRKLAKGGNEQKTNI